MTDTAELTDIELAEVVGGGGSPISKLQSGPSAQERVYRAIGMCGCGVAHE